MPPRREVVNAILYVSRTGVQWRDLPHDLPPRIAAQLDTHSVPIGSCFFNPLSTTDSSES
ncbi:transposase [Citreicoccus inhibens]|uniref:transposase n=1 Tax=Citreicoccus inhibens TaxID=2849499 RepID=UPI0038B27912